MSIVINGQVQENINKLFASTATITSLTVSSSASFSSGLSATGAGTSSTGVIQSVISGNDAFTWASQAVAANLTGGNRILHWIGQAKSNGNMAYFGFSYTGNNHASNYGTIGLWGDDDAIKIKNGGEVDIPKLNLNGTGTSNTGIFKITGSTDGAYIWASQSIVSSLTAGNRVIHMFGQASSAGNIGYIGFSYTGSDSASNYLTLGMYSYNDLVKIYKSGNVTIAGTMSSASISVTGGNIDQTYNVSGSALITSRNDTDGTSSTAGFRASYNGTAQNVSIHQYANSYTTNGMRVANSVCIFASGNTNGLRLFSYNAGSLYLGTNNTIGFTMDTNQYAQFSSRFACNGATPQGKAALVADASDLATAITLVNALKADAVLRGFMSAT